MTAVERDISVKMLASIVRAVRQTTIAAVYVETVPDMRKRGNPWWHRHSKTWSIRKRQGVSIVLGGTYRGAMDASRLRLWDSGPAPEPFVPQRRSWGRRTRAIGPGNKRSKTSSIVTYEGVSYLDVQRVRGLSTPEYVDAFGHPIPTEQVTPWLKPRTKRRVEWRDYRLENVRQIRFGGTCFNVRLDAVCVQCELQKAG